MPSLNKERAPLDGAQAYREGYEITDNPFYRWTEYFDEWIEEYGEAKAEAGDKDRIPLEDMVSLYDREEI